MFRKLFAGKVKLNNRRLLSVILAVLVVASGIGIYAVNAVAGEPQKTMLHFKRTSNGNNKFIQKIAEPLEAGVKYTVSLDYKFVKESFNNKIWFFLFGETSADKNGDKMIYATGYGKPSFQNMNDNGTTFKGDFTLSQEQLDACTAFYLGFYYENAQPEVYIADFVLYKASDANKTNLMTADEYATALTGWYTDYATNSLDGWGEGYVAYNAEYFPTPQKKMFHFSRTSSGTNRFVQKVSGTLEPGSKYVVSLDYKFAKESLNSKIWFCLFGETEANSANADKLVRTTGYGSATSFPRFEKTNDTGITLKCEFTLTSDEISKYSAFYVGFYYESAQPNIYLADIVLYKADDSAKENLLTNDSYATSLTGWYTDYGKNSIDGWGEGYIPYDETLFPKPKNTMLYFKRDNTGTNKLVQKIAATLKPNTNYTIAFKYKFISDNSFNNKIWFNLFGETSSEMYADTIVRTTGYGSKTKFEQISDDGVNVKYKFKLTPDEVVKYTAFYVGIYYEGVMPEMYIADLAVYEATDIDKVNILPNDNTAVNMEGWYNDWSVGGGSEFGFGKYVPYDEDMFPESEVPVKTMLHARRSYDTENKLAMKLKSGTLTAGEEYTVTFKYRFLGRDLEDKVYFCVMGETPNEMKADKLIYGYTSNTFSSLKKDGANATYKFTLTAEQIAAYSDFYIGYYYGAAETDADFYIAELRLYKSSDDTKTNLLPKDDYATDMSGWYNDWSTGGGTEFSESKYVPYDDDIFLEPVKPYKTMLHLFRDTDTANKFVLKVPTGSVKVNTEYTVTFRYHFVSRKLGRKVHFCIFGETDPDVVKTPFGDEIIYGFVKEPYITESTDGANAKYTFKITKQQFDKYLDYYVGFYYEASDVDVNAYVADLVMYESNDKTKTSILNKDEYSTDVSGWHDDWHRASGASFNGYSYVPLDDSIFVPDPVIPETDDGKWWKASDVEEQPAGYFTLNGVLKDSDGNGISGKTLKLVSEKHTYKSTTDSKGRFAFEYIMIDYYELYLAGEDGEDISTGYYKTFDANQIINLTLNMNTSQVTEEIEILSGSLKGTVYTAELKTVSGLKIHMGDYGEATSDKNGCFEFKDTPVGEYELYTLLEDGTKYVFRKANIEDGINLSVKLKYAPAVKSVNAEEGTPVWIWIVCGAVAVIVIAGVTVLVFLKKKQPAKK